MVRVKLENVCKRFGSVVAADNVCLDILEGEFFTILGPSGCGKTTTLRIIAGLERVDSGRVLFNDVDVTNTPPYLRGTGMVFQNYALWPHMTVFDNVAFGLKIRKVGKDEIRRRVKEVLEL
ncbi:MAG: ABC transporter ATP-binding protein, partial [archaeon YNP-WB-040]|nr:ABC transporter ATP-binding protein [Candidatus Culexarchaeum yellowstonense]